MSRSTRKPLQPLVRTGRWLQASVAFGAALATILRTAHSCGLIGDESTRLSLGTLAVHWIGVAPAVDTARAIGDTVRLVASVTDRRGTALVGAAIEWRSENPAVATVDSAGFVVARRPGQTVIEARVGERTARASIVVRPVAVTVRLADSAASIHEGVGRRFVLHAADARGHPVPVSPTWRSSDTAVAAVDAAGTVVGVAPGRATVVATVGTLADSAMVEVLPVPARLAVLSGDAQLGVAGSALPEPIVVRVESRHGHGIAGVVVRGRDGARRDSAITDSTGVAALAWTLAPAPGRQEAVLETDGLPVAARVTAEADPHPADTRAAQLGDPPTAPAGGREPVIVAVRVTDSLGRLAVGVPVAWTTADGTIAGRETRTDSLGEARAEWRVGARAGRQRARAVIGSGRSVPPVEVIALAVPGPAASIAAVTSPPYSGTAGTALAKPIELRVTDRHGNPVPGAAVSLAPAAGTLPDSVLHTDSLGRVRVHWTLGPASGEQALRASVPGVPPLRLVARAKPQAPANVVLAGLPERAVAGRPLGKPVRIRVTDVHGNPITGRTVAIEASAGSVSPRRLTTDRDGVATAAWTLGRSPGVQRLTVSVVGASARATAEVEAAAPPPAAPKAVVRRASR